MIFLGVIPVVLTDIIRLSFPIAIPALSVWLAGRM